MTGQNSSLDELCVNTIRMLAADAVEEARSGHPGLPLGAASMAYVLWTRFLRFNPSNPRWPDRDRFVLSAGHGSALLYALLHLTGYDLSLDELKRFRQWKSRTPGHPEYDPSVGIECTTGPLGQGFAMGVGMALAERFLAAEFNKPVLNLVDHFTYALVSDGDLMEGVASEAASLAGHLGLGKLVYLYDDNHISIEGDTAITFSEDVGKRFDAYGWQVLNVEDGNDLNAIASAIDTAKGETTRPSLIMIRTHIGFGSPKQDSAAAHGEPLGEDALRSTRRHLGWPESPRFHVPPEVLQHMRKTVERGVGLEAEWLRMLRHYWSEFPGDAERFENWFEGKLPQGWDSDVPVFKPGEGSVATRSASGKVLNALAGKMSNFVGGSADLAPSTKTLISGSADQAFGSEGGRNIRFGVREHAMGAITNGMALHGGIIPYAATFLIFSDYMRPSLRLAALMNVHSIFVFTHDSLAVGEDGPTHQPVEQLASLRAIPNFTVIRPADANETAYAWRAAMERQGPAALVLTRQNVPTLDRTGLNGADQLLKGAYVMSESSGKPDILLIASGSELTLALEAQEKLLTDHGISARVISMPSWEIFEEQPSEYRNDVLPPDVTARLSIEAGSRLGWCRWVGSHGENISVDRFGASAPGSEVLRNYGFTVENVIRRSLELLKK